MSEAFNFDSSIWRPEHPQPQKFRPEWLNLNGEWEFTFDHERVGLEDRWFQGKTLSKKIQVPFAHQYELSGINDRAIEQVVWYARSFEVPNSWKGEGKDVLLHFGAVDYETTVWLNGTAVVDNRGGHVPFSCNIAPYLIEGANRLVVRVEDSLDPYQPRGKQAANGVSRSCDYHGTTGIWQTVWIESVSSVRIEDFVFKARLGETDTILLEAFLHGPPLDMELEMEVFTEGRLVAAAVGSVAGGVACLEASILGARRWSPEDPFLYDIRLTLRSGERHLDQIQTYFGLREIKAVGDKFFLNGEPLYMKLVLDQGYWPRSGLTAPTDEALRADVEWCKRFGFNGARKHQKVEDPRWYYWCDKLGLLVWAEMANARAWSPAAEAMFSSEWERAVRRDLNHPCIVVWVPFNESWGLPSIRHGHAGQIAFLERTTHQTRRLDGSRLIVDNDGWDHTNNCDIYAIHDYTSTGKTLKSRYEATLAGGPMISKGWGDHPNEYWVPGAGYAGQPVVLSEVGGFMSIPSDTPHDKLDPLFGIYGVSSQDEPLERRYADIMKSIAEISFVGGFCYTQLTDVEQEVNGLLTYHRTPKVDPEAIHRIHDEMGK